MNQEKIGLFIAKKRKEKKMTQNELAEKLGVSNRSVSNWENGKHMPDLSLFKPLCEVLDIKINELMSGDEINDDDYQNKLEENIINLNINRNKKINKILWIIIIIILFIYILIIGKIIYDNVELSLEYNSLLYTCEISDNKLTYLINGSSTINSFYIERKIDDTMYYVFHNTINLYNIKANAWQYEESYAKIYNGFESAYAMEEIINVEKYDNIKVYYSNENLKNIDKLNDTDFLNILNDLYLMCNK